MKRQRAGLEELIVAMVFDRTFDPADVPALAARMGLESRTLQRWCRDADTTAKACLDLERAMKVVLADESPWHPHEQLSHYCKDHRTLERLIQTGCLERRPRSLAELVRRQRFVESPLRDAIIRVLRKRRGR
jgi:hypothetical protein